MVRTSRLLYERYSCTGVATGDFLMLQLPHPQLGVS